jgi:hypothetical protein
MERVSLISGKTPVIFVAPHGPNDDNTDVIAEIAAAHMNSYAVINRGFQRSDDVNVSKDQANCNNMEHCHKDVVREEFLEPIIRYKNRILKKFPKAFLFFIHGLGNKIKSLDKNIGYVVGTGAGYPNSFTCDKWVRDLVIYLLEASENHKVYQGKAGGNYAGWSRKNTVQMFRKWYPDYDAQAVQVEVLFDLREDSKKATVTGQILAMVAQELTEYNDFALPDDYKIRKI